MENNLEQPQELSSQSLNVNKIEKVGETESPNGSILGKFKNVKDLELAYQNLQAEFTKKSQKLSDVLKSDNETVAKTSVTASVLDAAHVSAKPASPLFETEHWKPAVSEFLKKNPAAKNYASEITQTLLGDQAVASLPNALDLAYAQVLAKHFKSENDLLKDESFVNDRILNNADITKKIISKYVSGIRKNVPTVIGSQAGSSVTLTPQEKPKTLTDASNILMRMLKTK